ncbi:GntR family transcriptional regulator [Alkalicoccus urumqiensis]|uniref:GntR family transcriptional regulator n=1 Tax=Alkalicoccus urumqiensis TaxID=1548213 RepID=A0A2P6MGW3_ALKUR|nr:GntR family transcriptional regulator [Alkalicoccus urumqiensis]PRO65470.1 GntR family transcriptional regulator [Alkalicoccus urumqiensis]
MNTKYNTVKEQIRSNILAGMHQPHEKIGSENELMKEHQVSRHTVRKAIDDLVNEGWLYKKQGAGTFCAERLVRETAPGGRKKNIAVITTYFSDYIFPTIIRGIEKYLSENGFHMTVFSTNNDIDQERRCLEAVLSQQFDGIIVEPTKSALPNPNINYYLNMERLGIPYVMINAYYEELEPLHLMMDDVKGAYLQTKHLLEAGHENIMGFFKNDDIQGTKRMKGFIKAHREHRLPVSSENIVTYTTEEKEILPMQALKERLRSGSQLPTGIVCYNDQLAVRLLDVIRERKIRVPQMLSLVGYDDSNLATASEVKLTTIRHPQEQLGEDSARILQQLIEGQQMEVESKLYDPELIIRTSTASKRPQTAETT